MITIDINKAREVVKARIRVERESHLRALDIEFQRALEQGHPTADIIARKQRLRDLPAEVDRLDTLEALQAFSLTNDGGAAILCSGPVAG